MATSISVIHIPKYQGAVDPPQTLGIVGVKSPPPQPMHATPMEEGFHFSMALYIYYVIVHNRRKCQVTIEQIN